MTMKALLLLFIAFAMVLLTAGLCAAVEPASPAEMRLREALRNTVIQLRTAQNETATAQAAQAELEAKNKALEAQVKVLSENSATERDAAKKSLDALRVDLESKQEQMAQFKSELEKALDDLKSASALAQSKEAERARLAADVIMLHRVVADQKTKNADLYQLGREILLRYEKFGLGEALGAREPFVGTTRVKLESFTQDFQDKLTDQKIKP
jgi:vacuolar-type H+-ATPase subunit E/Vma4